MSFQKKKLKKSLEPAMKRQNYSSMQRTIWLIKSELLKVETSKHYIEGQRTIPRLNLSKYIIRNNHIEWDKTRTLNLKIGLRLKELRHDILVKNQQALDMAKTELFVIETSKIVYLCFWF